MNNPWQQFTPYWLRTAAPFGSDLGLPALPPKLPWESSPPD
jgi:hypothetical protein